MSSPLARAAKCLREEEEGQTDYSTKPLGGGATIASQNLSAGTGYAFFGEDELAYIEALQPALVEDALIPVALSIFFTPVRLTLNDDFNEIVLVEVHAHIPRITQSV